VPPVGCTEVSRCMKVAEEQMMVGVSILLHFEIGDRLVGRLVWSTFFCTPAESKLAEAVSLLASHAARRNVSQRAAKLVWKARHTHTLNNIRIQHELDQGHRCFTATSP